MQKACNGLSGHMKSQVKQLAVSLPNCSTTASGSVIGHQLEVLHTGLRHAAAEVQAVGVQGLIPSRGLVLELNDGGTGFASSINSNRHRQAGSQTQLSKHLNPHLQCLHSDDIQLWEDDCRCLIALDTAQTEAKRYRRA